MGATNKISEGHVWAVKLREALNEWCTENGYANKAILGTELGIDRKAWRYISSGHAVVKDISAYAKLFLRTGLPEADPRQIPQRRITLPSGDVIPEKRAWTGERYDTWKNKQSTSTSARSTVHPQRTGDRTLLPVRSEATLGQLVDVFVGDLARRIVEEVRRQPTSADIGAVSDILYTQLMAFMEAGPDERAGLVDRYGEALSRLLPIIDALAHTDPQQRESAVSLARRMR